MPYSYDFVYKRSMLKQYLIIKIFFIALVAVSCNGAPMAAPTTKLTPFQKQPEPQSPLIKGEFSGLPADTLITIHVYTTSGREIQWGTRRGDGPWESVLPSTPDLDYVITADVDGYESTPVSYQVHVNGEKAFLIENNQVSINEALHLDFNFDLAIPITPN